MNSLCQIKKANALLSISILFSLTACGELPGFNVDAKTDDFVQEPVRNDKIDILFVIDNSGSMADEQAILAQSFEEFIKKFTDKKLDFQVGVISTDHVSDASWWSTSNPRYADFANAGPGSLLGYQTNERILRADSENIVAKFVQNSTLGIIGSGAEAGVKAATTALSTTMLGAGGWNEGFVRDEAMLAVVFVSDEDEGVLTGSTAAQKRYYIRGNATAAASRREAFVSRLGELKSDVSLLSINAVVAPTQAECPSVWVNDDSLLSTGDFYMDIANEYGGKIIPICRDFSGPIIELGADLVKLLSRFKLKQKPDGQIRVYVNGTVVERDEVNGWAYISETNEVEFRGDAIPASDALIEVVYVPGEPLG